ncbi:MAG: ABC-2 type transport system ATP-binding protein [Gammaproteobacteria bacterium]|jgi:ABC-2 type transport system ATP-binding protein
MIEVAQLTRRFGSLVAVDNISFSLERGEVVGFLGPNGAGKTTTMRILAGFMPATSAERVVVAGHDVLRESMKARAHIGYLPESVPLYRELRVREMMAFQGKLHGLSRAERKRRIPEVLDRVGVLDRESQLVGTLSRGLRQRVGLAVALLPRPEVMILDEPTSGLDPIQRAEVRDLLRSLADEHTVLLSSHILAEIEQVCPRVIILREGAIVADGAQADLVRDVHGAGHVRLEAFVGGDVNGAMKLLGSLPGVGVVHDRGKLGIHHAFDVEGGGDLREDVGALAAQKGWALRELSWREPTLEELFTQLVLGEQSARASDASSAPSASGPAIAESSPGDSGLLTLTGMGAPAATEAAPPEKIIYSLNPFDQGASRDLGRPMTVTPPPTVDLDPSKPADDASDGDGEACDNA